MRKFWFLAVLAALLTVSMPVQSADRGVDNLLRELGKEKTPAKKPVYSMWSPTYRAMTRQDIIESSIHYEKMKAEARSRKLNYALVGLVGMFGAIAVFSFVSARRRKIVSGADAAFIGTLATVVSAKRSLSSKIEARIASNSSASNRQPSQQMRQPISSTSEMLTPSEIQSLRQHGKEQDVLLQKALERR